ncbi:aldehyde dehydrogenase family protein, partial [Bacillus sp. mrc49]
MITTNIKRMKNNINGEWVDSNGTDVEEVINPANGKIIAYVPLSVKRDVDQAVQAAQDTYQTWSLVPVPNRARLLYNYLHLLQEQKEQLAEIITMENGKTLKDARGEVQRGIEVVEIATAAPTLMMGESLPG